MDHWNPESLIRIFKQDEDESMEPENNMVVISTTNEDLRTILNLKDHSIETLPEDFNFPVEAIELLINRRLELEELFLDCGDAFGIGSIIWEEIASKICQSGFATTGNDCKGKWETLYKRYVEIAKNLGTTYGNTWEYFDAFEQIYRLQEKEGNVQNNAVEVLQGILKTSDAEFRNEITISNEVYKNLTRNETTETQLQDSDPILGNTVAKDEAEEAVKYIEASNTAKLENTENETPCTTIERSPYSDPRTANWTNFVGAKTTCSIWDKDSTRCFLDLRLHAEKLQKLGQALPMELNSYVSSKMRIHGYTMPAKECKKKWSNMKKYYCKQVGTMKRKGSSSERVWEYFWQMDQVLELSGLARDRREVEWTKEAVRTLIKIRMPMENAFKTFKKYTSLWEWVASQLKAKEFHASLDECSIKWMELYSTYEECLDRIRIGEEDTRWDFFQDMHEGFMRNARHSEAIIEYVDKNIGPIGTSESLSRSIEVVDLTGNGNEMETAGGVHSIESKSFMKPEMKAVRKDLKRKKAKVYKESVLNAKKHRKSSQESRCSEDKATPMGSSTENTEANEMKKIQDVQNHAVFIIERSDATNQDPSLKIKNNLEAQMQFVEIDDPSSLHVLQPVLLLAPISETKGNKLPEILSLQTEDIGASRSNATDWKWSSESMKMLITLRLQRETLFNDSQLNEFLWKEIAMIMQSMGHKVSPVSCKALWDHLATCYLYECKENQSTFPEYREYFDLIDKTFKKKPEETESEIPRVRIEVVGSGSCELASKSQDCCKSSSFLWTEEAIRMLIELGFSRKGQLTTKHHMERVNIQMQCAGYKVTHLTCSKKWTRLLSTYRKCYLRRLQGRPTTWMYFDLIDQHLKELKKNSEEPGLEEKQTEAIFNWSREAVHSLIAKRLLMQDEFSTANPNSIMLLWRQISDVLSKEGSKVSAIDCWAKWNELMEAYKKTERKLQAGYGAVVGEHFLQMNEGMNKMRGCFPSGNGRKETVTRTAGEAEDRDGKKIIAKAGIDLLTAKNAADTDMNYMMYSYANYGKETKGNRKRNVNETVVSKIGKYNLIQSNIAFTDKEAASNYAGSKPLEAEIKESSNADDTNSNYAMNFYKNIVEANETTITKIGRASLTQESSNADDSNRNQAMDLRKNIVRVNESKIGEANFIQTNIDCTENEAGSKALLAEIKESSKAADANTNQAMDLSKTITVANETKIGGANLIRSNVDSTEKESANYGENEESIRAEETNTNHAMDLCKNIVEANETTGKADLIQSNIDSRGRETTATNTQENSIGSGKSSRNLETVNSKCNSSDDTKIVPKKRRKVLKPWSQEAVVALIDLKLHHEVSHPGSPRSVVMWDKIAAVLRLMGFDYSHTDCRRKWYRLFTTYKHNIQDMQLTGKARKWQYFEKMDLILKDGPEYCNSSSSGAEETKRFNQD